VSARVAIENVVFDIGWVFVRLNYGPLLSCLRAHGADAPDMPWLLERVALTEHESGRLSGREFLEQLATVAPRPPPLAELAAAWLDMFELEPAMVALAHRLATRYRVYLLSNIGDLHWAHLSREYALHGVGHGALPSFLAGAMKPHDDIYAEAERRFALAPAATVFVDDRSDNIEAARARGWSGIVHADLGSTLAALRALGVDCER
jgi:HAD superfamily hydrolase (TIGR01509 family)